MPDYVPGSLVQTLLGSKSAAVDSELDALFKNSAGPAKLPSLEFKKTYVHTTGSTISVSKSSNDDKKHVKRGERKARSNETTKSRKQRKPTLEEEYEKKLLKTEKKTAEKVLKPQEMQAAHENVSLTKSTDSFTKKRKSSRLSKKDKAQKKTRLSEDVEKVESKKDSEPRKKSNDDNNERPQQSDEADYKGLKRKFSEFGTIESIRFRSIAFSEPLPRKVAFIRGKLHAERDILNAYIVYTCKEAVTKALSMNAQVFLGKHLCVDSVANPRKHDRKRSVFIGSLPFDAQEEQLWEHFNGCGEIESVRIVRDRKTNFGKGFAYVQFKDRASVNLALMLHDSELGNRKIRVTKCIDSSMRDDNADRKSKKVMEGTRAVKPKKAPRIRTRTQSWKATHKGSRQKKTGPGNKLGTKKHTRFI
ncbi:1872_t:CDS:2 [Paraglomus occultum]|uniref:Nucleolar protein 12 n=1 Tax=Paraglomus occultum TaxID=144539 RepID=A0A9N9FXX7_9GLOM|nr:1872_t:CDS:2 [Paraglomus occultum]